MEELLKLKRAREYMQALSEGVDPLSGLEIPEDDVANQVRLCRCFAYVASVLDKVIQNGGAVGGGPRIVARLGLTEEQKQAVELSGRPIGITELAKRILAAAGVDRMRGVSGVSSRKDSWRRSSTTRGSSSGSPARRGPLWVSRKSCGRPPTG